MIGCVRTSVHREKKLSKYSSQITLTQAKRNTSVGRLSIEQQYAPLLACAPYEDMYERVVSVFVALSAQPGGGCVFRLDHRFSSLV